MLYLFLAILSSALLTVVMRVSERYSRSSLAMLAANYVMCTAASILYAGGFSVPAEQSGLGLAVGAGVVNGVLYLAGFVLLRWNISRNGMVLPATFMKLGVIVPTLAAMLIFGEAPRWTQLLGVAMAIGAILLIQGAGTKKSGGESGRKAASLAPLILLLLSGGTADTMSKVYETWGNPALKDFFLLFTFLVALGLCVAMCVAMCVAGRQRPSAADILFGLLLGIPNYYSARFLLLSLEQVPAVAAYPTFSVGTIVMVALAGALIFRERLEKRKLAALGVILASLVLLNI